MCLVRGSEARLRGSTKVDGMVGSWQGGAQGMVLATAWPSRMRMATVEAGMATAEAMTAVGTSAGQVAPGSAAAGRPGGPAADGGMGSKEPKAWDRPSKVQLRIAQSRVGCVYAMLERGNETE
jgi:hypothetical protein